MVIMVDGIGAPVHETLGRNGSWHALTRAPVTGFQKIFPASLTAVRRRSVMILVLGIVTIPGRWPVYIHLFSPQPR